MFTEKRLIHERSNILPPLVSADLESGTEAEEKTVCTIKSDLHGLKSIVDCTNKNIADAPEGQLLQSLLQYKDQLATKGLVLSDDNQFLINNSGNNMQVSYPHDNTNIFTPTIISPSESIRVFSDYESENIIKFYPSGEIRILQKITGEQDHVISIKPTNTKVSQAVFRGKDENTVIKNTFVGNSPATLSYNSLGNQPARSQTSGNKQFASGDSVTQIMNGGGTQSGAGAAVTQIAT